MGLEQSLKEVKVCPRCAKPFTCDVNCGNSHRQCFCPDCFKALIQKSLEGDSLLIHKIEERLKCSLLTEEDKEQLMLLFLTNKIRRSVLDEKTEET